jgi:hypothetical protein
VSQRPDGAPVRRFAPVKPSVPAGALIRQDQREEAMNAAIVAFERRDQYATEIHALWRQAQSAFLRIGHYLDLAKEKLAHGEFEEMIERDLPFDKRTAFMIRSASRAVRSGRLPAERLPPNYSVIYQLATLDDVGLRAAEAEGLLRPTLRRAEVIAFKRRLDSAVVEDTARRQRELAATRARILRQRHELDEQLRRIEAELRSLGATGIDGTSGRLVIDAKNEEVDAE